VQTDASIRLGKGDSFDDLIIASFTTGPGATTLPIRIYSQVRLGVKPEINAICTVLIAVVLLGAVTASLLFRRSQADQGTALTATNGRSFVFPNLKPRYGSRRF
jgi:ABC-type Fe3+ transport system permease subunit